jgi:hypothetical protein
MGDIDLGWLARRMFDPFENLFPVDRDVFWGGNPKADLISFYAQDDDIDIIADLHGLSNSPGQNQHD